MKIRGDEKKRAAWNHFRIKIKQKNRCVYDVEPETI